MTYADRDQLINDFIPGAKSTNEIAAVQRILESVSSFVDSYCRRASGYFSPSPTEPRVLRVRGEGHHFLRLPVHIFGSITEVRTSKGALIKPENYYESDKNGWLYAEEDGIYPEASFDRCSPDEWSDGQGFKVTARWGYAETPKDISEAVREIVKRIWEAQKGTLGQITPNGFVIERALPLFAKEILDKYKKREFEI